MVRNASLGHKMVPSRRVLEGNTGKTKHNFIIAKEHQCPPSDTIILNIGQLMIRGTKNSSTPGTLNDWRPSPTDLICLGKIEKVGHCLGWVLPPVRDALIEIAHGFVNQLRP